MHRRNVLRALGLVGVGGVAGCLGGGDGDDTADGEQTPTETPRQTENNTDEGQENGEERVDEAQQQFDEAVDLLVTNEDWLEELRTDRLERTEDVIDDLVDRLDEARELFDEVEELAPAAFEQQLGAARAVAGFQALLVEAEELGLETDRVIDEAERLDDAENDAGAVERYEQGIELLNEQKSHFTEIQSAHESLDTAPLNESAIAYDDEVYAYLGIDDEAEIDHAITYVEGRHDLAEGWVQLGAGDGEWQAERYDAAKREWEDGRDNALSASESFETLTETPTVDSGLQDFAERLAFVAGVQWETFDTLIDATEAALDGNEERATELYNEAYANFEENLGDL